MDDDNNGDDDEDDDVEEEDHSGLHLWTARQTFCQATF